MLFEIKKLSDTNNKNNMSFYVIQEEWLNYGQQ